MPHLNSVLFPLSSSREQLLFPGSPRTHHCSRKPTLIPPTTRQRASLACPSLSRKPETVTPPTDPQVLLSAWHTVGPQSMSVKDWLPRGGSWLCAELTGSSHQSRRVLIPMFHEEAEAQRGRGHAQGHARSWDTNVELHIL